MDLSGPTNFNHTVWKNDDLDIEVKVKALKNNFL